VRRLTVVLLVPGLLALGACAGQTTIIDWVDFVQWNGITYLHVPPGATDPVLGPQVAATKRKLADNETNPSHKLQEGDAAFLSAGTPIYSFRDYRAAFRIGVKTANGIAIYEADTNPKARTGTDLVDLEGKVDYISITDSSERDLATFHDPAAVAHLVGLILQAPVDQSVQTPPGGPQYFLAIHLHDGTKTVRAFWPSTGELQRGIMAGPEFARAIVAALPSPAA